MRNEIVDMNFSHSGYPEKTDELTGSKSLDNLVSWSQYYRYFVEWLKKKMAFY